MFSSTDQFSAFRLLLKHLVSAPFLVCSYLDPLIKPWTWKQQALSPIEVFLSPLSDQTRPLGRCKRAILFSQRGLLVDFACGLSRASQFWNNKAGEVWKQSERRQEQQHQRYLRGRHGRRLAYRANFAGNLFKSLPHRLASYQHDNSYIYGNRSKWF